MTELPPESSAGQPLPHPSLDGSPPVASGDSGGRELPLPLRILALAVFGAAAFAGLLWWQEQSFQARNPKVSGQDMPKLIVEGWINGPGPKDEDLRGKVVVLDAWAFWCGPCRQLVPHMKALHAKYSPRGVVFIGLTDEPKRTLPRSKEFIEMEGVTWPNAYGAVAPLQALHANTIPRVWVVDKQGKIVWSSTHARRAEELEEAIEAALDDSPAKR